MREFNTARSTDDRANELETQYPSFKKADRPNKENEAAKSNNHITRSAPFIL